MLLWSKNEIAEILILKEPLGGLKGEYNFLTEVEFIYSLLDRSTSCFQPRTL